MKKKKSTENHDRLCPKTNCKKSVAIFGISHLDIRGPDLSVPKSVLLNTRIELTIIMSRDKSLADKSEGFEYK